MAKINAHMRRLASDLLKVLDNRNDPVIDARVIGTQFNCERGERITLADLERGFQEMVVVVERTSEDSKYVKGFNLVSLLALAARGADSLLVNNS